MRTKHTAEIVIEYGSATRIECRGEWTINTLSHVAYQLELLRPRGGVVWDVEKISSIDTAGIALIQLYISAYEKEGLGNEIVGKNEALSHLSSLLYPQPLPDLEASAMPGALQRIGKWGYDNVAEVKTFLAFLGKAFVYLVWMLRSPSTIRWRSIASHIVSTGVTALPIIATSAFLIGVVVAYQSIVQLQKFGADIFIVDTIGISLTRELAPLITAIVVAGRSGSAFTAQLGAMKMTQEIDAMKTMGFAPHLFLVWPRVFALMIVMPLLIFFADMVGIFGGMVIAKVHSHLSFEEFLYRLKNILALKHYLIGILKGPFFAFLIAIVSTYRGLQVSLNTESIGRFTTRSVVNAIFLVIACDALFSILLTELKL